MTCFNNLLQHCVFFCTNQASFSVSRFLLRLPAAWQSWFLMYSIYNPIFVRSLKTNVSFTCIRPHATNRYVSSVPRINHMFKADIAYIGWLIGTCNAAQFFWPAWQPFDGIAVRFVTFLQFHGKVEIKDLKLRSFFHQSGKHLGFALECKIWMERKHKNLAKYSLYWSNIC